MQDLRFTTSGSGDSAACGLYPVPCIRYPGVRVGAGNKCLTMYVLWGRVMLAGEGSEMAHRATVAGVLGIAAVIVTILAEPEFRTEG